MPGVSMRTFVGTGRYERIMYRGHNMARIFTSCPICWQITRHHTLRNWPLLWNKHDSSQWFTVHLQVLKWQWWSLWTVHICGKQSA